METLALNNTLSQMNLIYREITLHPKAAEYTFVSCAHGTFSRKYNMPGHKTSLSKFKKTDIISIIFSNHNSMRLEINYKEKNFKKHKHMEAKQYTTKQTMSH